MPVALLVLLAGAFLPADGIGQQEMEAAPVTTELSLGEALDLAHQFNPEYRLQASALRTLDWERREVWAAFLPTASASNSFGYTASGERRFGDVSLATQPARYSSGYSVGLSLNLSGASFFQPGIQQAQARAVEADVEGASAVLVDQVTQAYLTVLRADAERLQAEGELERTGTYVREAEARVEVGAGTPLDIRRAEVQRGQAEVQLLQAENNAATARLTLGRLIGVAVPATVELSTRFELFEPDLDLETLLVLGAERNPSLLAARSRQAGSRSQVRAVQTLYLPSVSLSAGWSGSVFQAGNTDLLVQDRLGQLSSQFDSCIQDNRLRDLLGDPPRNCTPLNPEIPAVAQDAARDVRLQNQGFPFDYESQPLSLSMNVSIPLFTGFSRQLQVEEARVAEDNARQQVRAAELSLASDVEAALLDLRTARRTVTLRTAIRETAAEELRLAQERFRIGLANSIEVVEAQSGLSQAERDEINAVYDFHLSFVALEALVGTSLRGS